VTDAPVVGGTVTGGTVAGGTAARAIDVHGHAVPRAFLDEVVRTRPFGVEAEVAEDKYFVTFPGQKRLRPVAGVMLDTADRSGWFAEQEVSHQVVAPWLDLHGQELPAADGARWVRLLNDAAAESVADPARHMSAHAALHLADGDAAAEELRRAVRELGLRSAMIPSSLPSGRLSEPRFDGLWAAAVEFDVPVVLHPATNAPANDELLALYPSLNALFARQVDITMAAAELIMAGVFDRFPDLRLVLVHGGGLLPYQVGRFDRDAKGAGHRDGQMEGQVLRPPSEIAKKIYYDTVLMRAESVRFLLDYAGPGQVLIGSDFGAAAKERSGVRVTAALRAASSDPAVVSAVLNGNAGGLLDLG
jgi:aminocarboxymuconate-semialdehyde decarboxylase